MASDNFDIQIRAATPDDAPAIATVLVESFLEYKAAYTAEAFAATTPTSDQIRSRFAEGPVWVAVRDGVILGTVAAVARGTALYIRSMAVLPMARGLKLGALLLNQVEAFAATTGHQRLILSTTPFLTRAIRLYEQMGFRRSLEGPDDLYGTPLWTMEKDAKT